VYSRKRRTSRPLGGTLLPGSPDDFARLIAGETDKWGKLVNSLGLSVD
jgi:hypothetical protein